MLRTLVALVNVVAGGMLGWAAMARYGVDYGRLVYALLLGVNALLLFRAGATAATRPLRLLSLWFDAKEAELRRRTDQIKQEAGPA